MMLSLPYDDFAAYVLRQINSLFPDGRSIRLQAIQPAFDQAVDRTAFCFRHVAVAGYNKDGKPALNHLHSDQYAVFLWFLSNSVWTETGDQAAADKIFYANKALNGFSCMYDTQLPDIFLLLHTTGTVLGKAAYSNYFAAAHGCTVGSHHGYYPVLGEGVAMLPGSSIIGQCAVGDRVSVGIGAAVYERDVPSDTVVYRDAGGQIRTKRAFAPWAGRVFTMP
jgi:serine O-acetyltransferase